MTICRLCQMPIGPHQFRFGSPSTGWSHMEGECIVLSGVTEHPLAIMVRINQDVAQGDELDLVRGVLDDAMGGIDLEGVRVIWAES